MQGVLTTIITTTIGTLTGALVGYLINSLKNAKKTNSTQNEAIKCLLRANIVNQYYVYKKIGIVPFYVKESLHKEFEAYKGLNGNSFVEDIMKEIDTWKTE